MADPGGCRYVYLVAEGLPPTVIDSQVVSVLRRLARRGLVFDLFIYQLQAPREGWDVQGHLAAIRRELPGRVRLWPWPARRIRPAEDGTAPAHSPAPSTLRRRLRNAVQTAVLSLATAALQVLIVACLAPAIVRGQVIVVHARGAAADLAVRLKRWYPRLRVVADVRGDSIAEYLYSAERRGLSPEDGGVRRERERMQAHETRVLARADAVQCVSQSLRQRLETEAGVSGAKIRVVPCLADDEIFYYDAAGRDRVRHELGVGERTLFVYSGSLLAWQSVGTMLRLWSHMRRSVDGLHLLLLTPQAEAARRLLKETRLEDNDAVSVHSARHDEVRAFLCAADVALLIREPHPLNRVASPTKFAEYALTGLPVVASRGIGDLDAIIEGHGLGVLLGDPDDPAEVEATTAAAVTLGRDGQRTDRALRAAGAVGLGARLGEWVQFYAALARPAHGPGA